jgi:outer membrane lipoprotein LolB
MRTCSKSNSGSGNEVPRAGAQVNRLRDLGLLLMALLALVGCAHAPPAADGLDVAARRARIAALPGWDMRGRIAIDTGERAVQARFRWLEEQPDALLLNVRGLFGAGSFEIKGNDDALTLRTRGETWSLVDPETELSARFGWWLPVGSLDAWLVGLPDDAYEARVNLGANGALATLEQRLWMLEFTDYELAEGLLLPRTIEMHHGELRLRLTVDSWSPLQPAPDVQ